MAREFIDGFEGGDTSLWTVIGANVTADNTSAMTGVYCAKLNSDGAVGGSLVRTVTGRAEYYGAFKFKTTTGGSHAFRFRNGSTVLGVIKMTIGVGIKAYNGNEASLLGTGSTSFVTNVVYRVQFYYKPDTTGAGRFVIKINEVAEIDYTGASSPATSNIDTVEVRGDYTYTYGYFDDIVLDSSEYPGLTYVQAIVPTGVGFTTNFTPSAGSNYACVDEIPPSDTDYVSTNTADNIDTYATGNMTGSVGEIKCVQVQIRAKTEGSPTPTKLALMVRSSSTDYAGTDQAITSAYLDYRQLWAVDPATSSAWTESGVNAVEIGIKARA
jgi:hypothetical protein